ncbi:MICAL-like protein 2 isoform 4-T6 [Spinachia spinachia]
MSAVKALQQWCRVRCEGYRDVSITNMTTSFRDGLAFCALLHHHRPDLIDFDSLKKDDVYENNKLAFQVAQDLGIPALLDAEDMVALKVPDRLSILTYVSQYYNYFHGRSPIGGMGGVKRPAGDPAEGPSGKKNQPVAAKVFPSTKPARENSPPPSSNITRPPPPSSPRAAANATKDAAAHRSPPTGTLSNKCASCDKHVHLVQRHLVEGKLYHRSCARTLSSTNPTAPPRGSPSNVPVSRSAPFADSGKTTATPAPSRPGPSWLPEKAGASLSPSPPSSVSPKGAQTRVVSAPPRDSPLTAAAASVGPVAAPRTSTATSNKLQSRLKVFQGQGDEEKKTPPAVVTKRPDASATVQQAAAGKPVSVVVSVGGFGRKEASVGPKPGEDAAKAAGGGGGVQKSKASAAAFISKMLSEGNDDAAKMRRTTEALKKPDVPPQVETPKREPQGVRGRKVLRADRSLLDDAAAARTPSPARPDRGGWKPNATASENQDSPEDWRSKLKPVSKPAGPPQSSAKPWANGGGAPQTSHVSVGPSPSPQLQHPSISVTPPAAKGFMTRRRDPTPNGTKSELKKTKPDYISKEDIISELQEIEDHLDEWEKRGVELEARLRGSEAEGEEDSRMDELMVEWFNLIRNKQVAMRRESELVYVGKTQDLEEEQPTVEQELRRLMDKPERLKTAQDRRREKQLMDKLVEIVNDRNAIVEGLDEDRLREDEEDEELNKMMMSLNMKKDKPKKKSPLSKLFGWGTKKDA